jgi:hypothetical protein
MASFTDAIPQFNPYIQQLPVEAMVSVGMQKQQQYDQGIQRIQSEIDRVAGLDIVRDVDRQYLQSKLNDLGSKLRTVAAGDFSNFQLVNSVAGMAGKVAKDNTVISAVQASAKYRKEQAFMEEARQKGESAIQNEYDFMQQTDKWMNDEKVGAGYNGRYRKYIDVDKKWLEVIKGLHSDLLEEDIPYAYNKDGSINSKETAAAMQRISKEGVSANKIQNALRASLSPDELEQLNINGKYEFRNIQDPAQLAVYATTKNATALRQNTEEIERLKGLMKMYDSDPEKYRQTEQGIISLEEINKNLQEEMNYELELINTNPEAAKGYIYRRGAIEQFANAHAWEKQKQNILTNPIREDEWKARNYSLDVTRENRMQAKDNFEMQLAINKADLERRKLDAELYGVGGFRVAGGLPTKVEDQEKVLLRDIDGISLSMENQVNDLYNQINSAGEGKVEKIQILNALDAYMKGDVTTYESLIPYNYQNLAESIIETKRDLNIKEDFLKTVQSEAIRTNKTIKEIINERTIQPIPYEIPITVTNKEGNQSRSTWEGIATSLLRKAADTSLSGMRGGYEGLDADDAEEALAWFGEKGGKDNINYKIMERGAKTFLVLTKGTEAFDIPLSQDEVARLPFRDSNSQSPQYRKLMEFQAMGSGTTNPSRKYENSFFGRSSMPKVNLNVRADMTSEYQNSGRQYITLRLKLPDGTVYPLELGRDKPMAVDPDGGMKFIADLDDKKIKQWYLESPKVNDSVKEVIRNM